MKPVRAKSVHRDSHLLGLLEIMTVLPLMFRNGVDEQFEIECGNCGVEFKKVMHEDTNYVECPACKTMNIW